MFKRGYTLGVLGVSLLLTVGGCVEESSTSDLALNKKVPVDMSEVDDARNDVCETCFAVVCDESISYESAEVCERADVITYRENLAEECDGGFQVTLLPAYACDILVNPLEPAKDEGFVEGYSGGTFRPGE